MSSTIRFIFIGLICLSICGVAHAKIPFGATSEPFPADVYASQRAALVALAHQCAEALKNPDGSPGPNVEIAHGDSSFDAASAQIFLDTVGQDLKMKSHSGEATEVKLLLTDKQTHPSSWSKKPSAGGRFIATFNSGKSTRTISVSFIEKSWADDWQMFVNGDSSHRWLTSQSPTPAVSSDEAIGSARRAATDSLLQLVQTELNARGSKLATLKNKMTADWLEKRIIASLQRPQNDGILIVDTFIQKFSRPYGDVWQASVLIDASPKVIGELADSYTNKARADFGTKAAGAIAIAGMVGVLGLLYAFINAVTKGYFMWRLRAVAFLAAIAGILIVFAVV